MYVSESCYILSAYSIREHLGPDDSTLFTTQYPKKETLFFTIKNGKLKLGNATIFEIVLQDNVLSFVMDYGNGYRYRVHHYLEFNDQKYYDDLLTAFLSGKLGW